MRNMITLLLVSVALGANIRRRTTLEDSKLYELGDILAEKAKQFRRKSFTPDIPPGMRVM